MTDRIGLSFSLQAIIETDMPSPRTLNSVQSDTHGLVLWCPIDSGRVRMGYVFNKSLQEKYGENGVTGEVAMEEAKKAVAPFKLEFKKLDWFTLYVSANFSSSFLLFLSCLLLFTLYCLSSAFSPWNDQPNKIRS